MKRNLLPIALSLLVVLTVIYLAFDLHQDSKEEMLAHFRDHQHLIARQIASQMQLYFTARSRGVHRLSSLPSLQNRDLRQIKKDIQEYFERVRDGHIEAITVNDSEGGVVYPTTTQGFGLITGQDEIFDWAKRRENKDKVFLSWQVGANLKEPPQSPEGRSQTPLQGPRSPRLQFFLSAPIYQASKQGNAAERFGGLISMRVDLEGFVAKELVLITPSSTPEEIWVMDKDGTLLLQSAHPEMEARNIRQRDRSCHQCHVSFSYAETMLTRKEGAVDYELKGRPKKLAAFAPMEFENASWVIVVNVPYGELTGFIKKELNQLLILLAAVVVSFSLSSTLMYRNYRLRVRAEEESKQWREKQALEEKVRQSEERYRTIVETAHDMFWTLDHQGLFTFINSRGEEISGYQATELIGRSFFPLIHPDDLTKVQRIFDASLAGRLQSYEVRLFAKEGQTLVLSVNTVPMYEGNKVIGVVSSGRDITEEKQDEEALQESGERYRRLVESSPNAIAIHSEGKFVFINSAGAKLLGASSAEELLGKPIYDFVHPENRALVQERVRQVREEGKAVPLIEEKFIRMDGAPIDVEVSAIPHTYRGKPAVQVVIHDITEHKRTKQALESSESRLRLWFDRMPIGCIVWSSDFRVASWNPAAEKIFGFTAQEALGKHPYDLIVPREVQSQIDALWQRLLQGDAAAHSVNENLTKDGRWILCDWTNTPLKEAHGTVLGVLSMIQDITEQKSAEAALRASEEKYRRFFEEDVSAVYISTPEGRLLACNPAFLRIFGYDSTEELLRTNVITHYPDPEARHTFLKLLREKKKLERYEIKLRRKDGTPIYAVMNSSGTFNEQGDLVEMQGYIFDDTERKNLEQQFLQAQKMEAVGRLAGGVAHDFNNLLTVVTGFSELLLARLDPTDPLRKQVEEIKKAGERAASLTRQLLAFSRRQVLEPRVLDLNAVIAEMEKMLRRLIGEDIDLRFVPHSALGPVEADPGQIGQVIMNLVVNSRDAMPSGGKLIIETANVELDEEYARTHADAKPGDYVKLAVSDTGCGMSAEVQSHIFEPFFTTKEKGKGTGLGLPTVYGIVKQSGGHIIVYSEEGRGTTFKVYLPRVTEAGETVRTAAVGPEQLQGSETILLVEDDVAVRTLASKILRVKGYTVLEGTNGSEAIQICQTHQGTIDLLITDALMPRMSGRELADKIVSLRPKTKILHISGYAQEPLTEQQVLKDNTFFLGKPFSADSLARKVREVLDH